MISAHRGTRQALAKPYGKCITHFRNKKQVPNQGFSELEMSIPSHRVKIFYSIIITGGSVLGHNYHRVGTSFMLQKSYKEDFF